MATNPYIAFPTLLVLTATAASLLWQRRLSLSRAVGFMAALGVTSAVVAYALGFFIRGGKGYDLPGYRVYALNLLAPFDPYIYGAILSRLLPRFPLTAPYDLGCSYLGAGIIFLAILLAILFALQPAKRPSLNKRQVLPLFLCCLVLTLLALSTKVMIGTRTLVDVDPQQHLTRFLGPLKTSLTLFWFPNYAILLTVLARTFLFFRRCASELAVGPRACSSSGGYHSAPQVVALQGRSLGDRRDVEAERLAAFEIADLVRVGLPAPESRRPSRMAVWGSCHTGRIGRLPDFRLPGRRAEYAHQQLPLIALHRSQSRISLPASDCCPRRAAALAGYRVCGHALSGRGNRKGSDGTGKMPRTRWLHPVLYQG